MRLLVTGSSGYLGSKFIERLLADKYQGEIIGLDINPPKVSGYTHVEGDVRRINDCTKAVTEYGPIDIVYHLAALSSIAECERLPRDAFDINVLGTVNMLSVSETFSPERFVFASSREVYGYRMFELCSESSECLPFSQYGASKLAAEAYVNASMLESCNLRFTNILGWDAEGRVLSNFLNRASQSLPLYVHGTESQGTDMLDFVHIEDAVQTLIDLSVFKDEALPFQAINVCSGDLLGIDTLALKVRNIISNRLNISKSELQLVKGHPFITNLFRGATSRYKECFGRTCSADINSLVDLEITRFLEHYKRSQNHATT